MHKKYPSLIGQLLWKRGLGDMTTHLSGKLKRMKYKLANHDTFVVFLDKFLKE